MWVWMGRKRMRPGSRFSRAMWLASLPVAAVLIWFGWTQVGTGSTVEGKIFLIVWTVGIVAIGAWNFRTMYLGRGRGAEAVRRLTDPKEPSR